MDDYAPGCVLPPHLSPFVQEGELDYVPPERVQQIQDQQEMESEQAMEDEISSTVANEELETQPGESFYVTILGETELSNMAQSPGLLQSKCLQTTIIQKGFLCWQWLKL